MCLGWKGILELTVALGIFCPATGQAQALPFQCETYATNPTALATGFAPGLTTGPAIPVTCTIQVTVPQKSKFVIFGIQETYSYWVTDSTTPAGKSACELFGCTVSTITATLTGPSGSLYSHSVSGSAAVAPFGTDWTEVSVDNPPVCLGSGCSNCKD